MTKKVTYNGEPDKVTEDFYVALFSDEDGTDRVSEVETISLKEASQGDVTFTGLSVGSTYYVYETDAEGTPVGIGFAYVAEGQGQGVTIERNSLHKSAVIVNNCILETIDVSGSKTWKDEGNEDARPESVTIRLYADNKEIAAREVTESDGWSWNFTDLPKYRDGAEGQEIVYTISEDAVENYTSEIHGYNVVNTCQPGRTSVSVAKHWDDVGKRDGKRPEGVKVQLYADGKASGDPIILNESNCWRYTWSSLEAKENGSEIRYTVKEVGENQGSIQLDGTVYNVTYAGNAAKGYIITNSRNISSTGVQTGDDTSVIPGMAGMFASAVLAGTMLIYRRRRYGVK